MTPILNTRQERLLLLTLAGIQFSHVLDFMIMMPLGPVLMETFAIDTHHFGLLVASYSFSAAIAGLCAASFVDRFERRAFLLCMFALFGIATLLCALSSSYEMLLLSRCCAGIFGGLMGAQVQTMIGDVIPFERLARASSFVAAAFSLSTVAGVPLSLWLVELWGWRTPFFLVVFLTFLFVVIGLRALPTLNAHINIPKRPFDTMKQVIMNHNHLKAFLFSALVIFSGFVIIPYIALYSVRNIGIAQTQVALLYLCGGAATLITGRIIGYWADQQGKVVIFRLIACLAIIPLLLITQLNQASLIVWLICTTLFFVLVSGRMIPVIAIVVSTTPPQLRGTFMSLNATVQQLASGSASMLAGIIIAQDAQGKILHYDLTGWLAVALNLTAVYLAGKIVMHKQPDQPKM